MFSFEIRSVTRWVAYLFAAGILLGSLLYSQYLANQLAQKERENAQLYADALKIVASDNSDAEVEALTFIFDLVQLNTFPKILLNADNSIITVSEALEPPTDWSPEERQAFLQAKVQQFKQEFDPIKVQYAANQYNTVVYGESFLLKQLRWFPLGQLLVAFTFIGIVFAGFAVAKRNEQNRVWVGLAKETAHQLGTPVSSLMAWIELLKLNTEDQPENQELVRDMEHDIKRLEMIAERFSKIGSVPELIPVKLKDILDRSADYLTKRMTRSGAITLSVNNQLPLDRTLAVNPQLFDWVIENLLKNALDAMQSREGSITLEAGEKGDFYLIDVTDTGKGIPKSHFKKVFEPGFTTKKRGWGLGLSLTKRIVENYHGGKIFVKDSEVGKGTTFRVLLPKGDRKTQR